MNDSRYDDCSRGFGPPALAVAKKHPAHGDRDAPVEASPPGVSTGAVLSAIARHYDRTVISPTLARAEQMLRDELIYGISIIDEHGRRIDPESFYA